MTVLQMEDMPMFTSPMSHPMLPMGTCRTSAARSNPAKGPLDSEQDAAHQIRADRSASSASSALRPMAVVGGQRRNFRPASSPGSCGSAPANRHSARARVLYRQKTE